MQTLAYLTALDALLVGEEEEEEEASLGKRRESTRKPSRPSLDLSSISLGCNSELHLHLKDFPPREKAAGCGLRAQRPQGAAPPSSCQLRRHLERETLPLMP